MVKELNRVEITKKYWLAFTKLDISYIENLLDDDFYYTSAYLPNIKLNKYEYLNFLKTKFDKIKSLNYKILVRSDHSVDLYIETEECSRRIGILRIIKDKGKVKKALIYKSYITEKELLKVVPG
mgnify:CR=1 FL=1